MRIVATLALVAGLSGVASAFAAEGNAMALFEAGKYAQAEKAGATQGDAVGFGIASRAVLADDMTHAPCLECLKRAEDYARRAIAADPKYPEGHIYLAAAMGYESRIIGVVEARIKGYAREAKDNLDLALTAEPHNAWALAAMGGWNIEVVRAGGETLAHWLYGATVDDGRAYFAKAFTAEPDNLVIRYQYALVLGGYDLDTYRKDVEDSLARAAADKAHSAYETFAQARARELLTTLRSGDRAATDQMIRRDQGYP